MDALRSPIGCFTDRTSYPAKTSQIQLPFSPKHLISSDCGDEIDVMLYFPIHPSQSAIKAMKRREN